MLERAALHQTRFRTPGVGPDARGVVLGQRGVVLFPSLDRLVTFLRAYGDDASLDELLPSLQIRRLVTPLRTREIALSVQSESSYRMDRVASIAKLAGGLVFTGTSRHFVKYRDPVSPLGYDVQDLADEPADLVLYHDSFRQAYRFEREIDFRELVLKLAPYHVPIGQRRPVTRVFVTSEMGIGASIVRYLFRWRAHARVALAEWPSDSAFDDASRKLYVLDIEDSPGRIITLLESLPGVNVFEPLGDTFAVELGYRHPLALESCASLFQGDALYLFRGDGRVVIVSPLPPFAPVGSLVRTDLRLGDQAPAIATARNEPFTLSLPLRMAPTAAAWRNVVASIVPSAQREWLARLLYALPPKTLGELRIAIGADRVYLLDPSGIEGVPLGTFYCEVAPRIYVPAGMTLVPAVAPDVLEDLVRDREGGHVFFEPGEPAPRVVPEASFAPLSRRVLREVSARPVHADAPEARDPALPLLEYDAARIFPLWGAAGRDGSDPSGAPPSDEA